MPAIQSSAAKHHIRNPLQTTTYEKRALTLLVSAPAVYPCQLLMQPDCQTHSEWYNNPPPQTIGSQRITVHSQIIHFQLPLPWNPKTSLSARKFRHLKHIFKIIL